MKARFEYKIVDAISLAGGTIFNKLNELGNEGWELVSVLPGFFYFKRRID